MARELNTLNEKILGRRQDVEAPGGGDGSGGGGGGAAGGTSSNLEDLMAGKRVDSMRTSVYWMYVDGWMYI